jgi:hypothetical protein
LAILPDGKILVSGAAKDGFAVFRSNSNGSRDTSFGANGIAFASFGDGYLDYGKTLQVQPGGKIVVFVDISRFLDLWMQSPETNEKPAPVSRHQWKSFPAGKVFFAQLCKSVVVASATIEVLGR